MTPDAALPSHGPYTARVLPPEEWDAKLPELLHYPRLPDAREHVLLVVVEDSAGRIVASWMACNTIHLEGLVVTEEARTNPAVAKKLLTTMLETLTDLGVPGVLTLAETPSILSLARKEGFEIVPGTLLKRPLTRL